MSSSYGLCKMSDAEKVESGRYRPEEIYVLDASSDPEEGKAAVAPPASLSRQAALMFCSWRLGTAGSGGHVPGLTPGTFP